MRNIDTLNPYSTNVLALYPLKTSENLWFSVVFTGYRSGTLIANGLSGVYRTLPSIYDAVLFMKIGNS